MELIGDCGYLVTHCFGLSRSANTRELQWSLLFATVTVTNHRDFRTLVSFPFKSCRFQYTVPKPTLLIFSQVMQHNFSHFTPRLWSRTEISKNWYGSKLRMFFSLFLKGFVLLHRKMCTILGRNVVVLIFKISFHRFYLFSNKKQIVIVITTFYSCAFFLALLCDSTMVECYFVYFELWLYSFVYIPFA